MIRILVADGLAEAGLQRLQSCPGVAVEVRTGLSAAELKGAIPDYDAVIVRSTSKVTREVVEAGVRLKVIGRAGVGLDNIDCQAAAERQVSVVNTPNATTIAVAELVMGMMLATARHIVTGTDTLRAGRWDKSRLEGMELFGKTLGLIGIGRIGKEVARRARAFGMSVVATRSPGKTHRPDPDFVHWSLQCVGIDDLLSQSDIISIHAPLTDATRGMLGQPELARMKKGAILINCARGGIVDESALYQTLVSGHLAAAGLDVFTQEPPQSSPLLALENVVATPHLGASAREAQVRAAVDVADKVLEVLFNRRQVDR